MARVCAAAAVLSCAAASGDVLAAFEKFQVDFNRTYQDDAEATMRFKNFARTLDFVNEENAKGHSYTLGINEFSDMSEEEFAETHMMRRQAPPSWDGLAYLGEHVAEAGVSLPASVDWTSRGAVTGVKNQGQCGSCWTFSTTGAIEGAWAIATGSLVSLSEQQIVSCCHSGGQGCSGGWPYRAMQWAQSQNLCTEASYPYTSGGGSSGYCQSGCRTGVPAGGVVGYRSVSYGTEPLMQAVAQQPVSILVDGASQVFQSYSGGILQQYCGTQQDHAVLLVGYGNAGGIDYWKVKNSWGYGHGEGGYWRLARGNDGDECGLLAGATYPVVNGWSSAPAAPAVTV